MKFSKRKFGTISATQKKRLEVFGRFLVTELQSKDSKAPKRGLWGTIDISFAPPFHFVDMLARTCIAFRVASKIHYARCVQVPRKRNPLREILYVS